MRKRLLSLALALGLVTSLIAGAISVSATVDDPFAEAFDCTVPYHAVFSPWAPNGDIIDGTGPWYSTITVQNVDDYDIKVFFLPYIGLIQDINPASPPFNIDLGPHASQTVNTNSLPFASDPGSSVVLLAVFLEDWKQVVNDTYWCGEVNGAEVETESHDGRDSFSDYAPFFGAVQKQVAATNFTSGANTGPNHVSVDGHNLIPMSDVAWGPLSDFCFWINGINFCDGSGLYWAGMSVDLDLDGHSYLPIVQTNSGWNSVIYVSNTDDSGASVSQVQVELITTDQQGFGAGFLDKYWLEASIGPGETWVIDVSDHIGPGWVGSAWITAETGMTVLVYRSKAETNMMLTNVAAPSLWATVFDDDDHGAVDFSAEAVQTQCIANDWYCFEMYAPLVFKAYNGWNTGFSFVNIAEITNTIIITYYDDGGTVVGGDMRTVSPGGQEFIFTPHYQDANLGPGFKGTAVFTSIYPFHVAIDQVKYSTGEAMSYLATAAGAGNASQSGFDWGGNRQLFMPLIQKGNATTGMGATSGVQLFNAGSEVAHLEILFRGGSGQLVEPTKNGPYPLTLGQFANGTLYMMTFHEMATGVRSAMEIYKSGGQGNRFVVGVSNNVDYQVQGDGAVAYNMMNARGNWRYPTSQADFTDDIYFPSN